MARETPMRSLHTCEREGRLRTDGTTDKRRHEETDTGGDPELKNEKKKIFR